MSLLSGAFSGGNLISVVVLCIVIAVFLFIDIFLVVSLHKSNNKLVKGKDITVPEEVEEKEVKENTET